MADKICLSAKSFQNQPLPFHKNRLNYLLMKYITFRSAKLIPQLCFLSLLWMSTFHSLSAQFTVELTVLTGEATTTCTDGPFNTAGEPTWGVAVEDEPVRFYSNDCPNLISYPNQNIIHFSRTVDCLSDLNGGELFVCLWAFDNDIGGIFTDRCAIETSPNDKGCLEVVCGQFVLPTSGTEITYTLDESNFIIQPENIPLESSGSVTFTISVSEDATDRAIAPNDRICNSITIPVTTGGTVEAMYNNKCATSIDDPMTDFTIENSVWFNFIPSQSRRVFINVNSELPPPVGTDPIQPEIAVFFSESNECDAPLVEVPIQNTSNDPSSIFLSLECLNPKLTYYIMVDGQATDPTGNFSVVVAERGYADPIQADTVICRGELITVGENVYVNAGLYLDTIVTPDDCAVIVETNLQVVEALELDLRIGSLARGEGEGGGVMVASAQFGTGDYSFAWSTGQTNQVANNLIGGESYCLTVTDNNAGCTIDTCFIMEFPIPIVAEITDGSLNCATDISGQIQVTVNIGKPPYQYRLQGIENPSIIAVGAIAENNTTISIDDLPAGNYNIFVSNEEDAQNFVAQISAPPLLGISLVDNVNASCFETCDGQLEVVAVGGAGDLSFAWDNDIGNIQNPTDLCAGLYNLTVTDENGCQDSAQFSIIQPAAIDVDFTDIQSVVCFGETNGQATVTANEPISSIIWDNGSTTATVNNLSADIHEVWVTNASGCTSMATVEIEEPNQLLAAIEITEAVACGGDANGVLTDITTGGTGNYEYIWNTGSILPFIENLVAGDYDLTVRDANGCVEEARITLEEPTPIDAMVTPQDVTCPGGVNSGQINFTNSMGGTAPYRYALDNQSFGIQPTIENLSAGTYSVTMQDDNGCEKVFEQIIVNDPPEVTVNLGEDKTINLGNSIDLKATANRQVTFEWFSTDSLSCLDCATVSARPLSTSNYTVQVTDEATGCTAEDAITISVLQARNLFVPNAFSPNGDGINDVLGIFGGENIDRILRFEIYARNGSRVFERSNFLLTDNIGWDGEFERQKLSTDVFIYFAEVEFIDGVKEVFSGDFTLVR